MRYFLNGIIILSLACSSEDGLKVYNADPSISIQSHGMDAEIQEALPTMFWAQASDGNHSFDELVCSWYVYDAAGNELSSCDWAPPDDEGVSSCELTFGSEAARVSVNVKDPLDAADADEITIQIVSNEPPSIEILKPTASEYYYADAAVPFHAQVSDAEDSPEDLLLEWSSSLDGDLELGAVADSAGLSQSSTTLTAGEHEIRLEVTDSAENTVSEIVTIVVYEANEPPSCEIVTPQDGESFASGDPILFSATATDPNVSSDQLVVEWYSDKDAPLADGVALGSSVPSSSDGSISFAATALSVNVHTITMLVTDEQGSTCTVSVLFGVAEPGQAPHIFDLDIDPDPIYNDSTLICSASVTDPDSSYLSSYSWTNTTQATSIGSNDPYIAMQPSLGMPGDVISCELEVSDSIGSDVSAAYKTIENRAPTTSATVSPTTASVTALLTCTSSSSDPDEEAVAETYTWTNTTTGQVLGTGSTLQLTSSMASSGDTIVCTVEATDESGETATATASTDILQPPFINTIEIDPTPLYNDSNLTCTATVYDPTGNATLTYSWEIDGVSAGTGSSLSLSSTIADPQDAVRCSAFVTDGLNSDQLD
ncbi:MAG: Ig-like domain-containing protein, partial [Myxococcota bacterium]|nr:Ig-like domain-containing protein [Myxococcota bacterium]